MNKKIVIIGNDEEAQSFQEFFGAAKGSVVAINTMKFNDPEDGLTEKELEYISAGIIANPSHFEKTYESIPLKEIRARLISLTMGCGVSLVVISRSIASLSVINEMKKIAKWSGIKIHDSGYSFNNRDNRTKQIRKLLEGNSSIEAA